MQNIHRCLDELFQPSLYISITVFDTAALNPLTDQKPLRKFNQKRMTDMLAIKFVSCNITQQNLSRSCHAN